MTREELVAYIGSHFEGKLTEMETGKFDPWFEVKAEDLVEVCQKLHDDENLKFDFLCDLAGNDTRERFEVSYKLVSLTLKHRLDLRVALDYEGAEIESVQHIWAGANWHEREVWELYGINIKNHDNLTRFLLHDEWDEGFPMRKDWDGKDFVRLPEI